MHNATSKAIYIVLKEYGLTVENLNSENNTIYISVPKTSDMKQVNGSDVAGIYLAKKFKETFNSARYTVKYRIRDEHWTSEMARSAKNFAEDAVFSS